MLVVFRKNLLLEQFRLSINLLPSVLDAFWMRHFASLRVGGFWFFRRRNFLVIFVLVATRFQIRIVQIDSNPEIETKTQSYIIVQFLDWLTIDSSLSGKKWSQWLQNRLCLLICLGKWVRDELRLIWYQIKNLANKKFRDMSDF